MGTLSSELTHVLVDAGGGSRASTPTPTFRPARSSSCAAGSGGTCFFVLEHEDLRRAPDLRALSPGPPAGAHADHARSRLHSTIAAFPQPKAPASSCSRAPDERWLRRLMRDVDRQLLPRGRGRRAAARGAHGPVAHRRRPVIDSTRGSRGPRRILSGAAVVLPDRIIDPGTIVIDHGRIAGVEPGLRPAGSDPEPVDCRGSFVVPGFIDVHVHGVEGADALDGARRRRRRSRRACRATASPRSARRRSPARRRALRHDARRPSRAARHAAAGSRACCRRISRATSSTRSTAARSRSSASACPRGGPSRRRRSPATTSWPRSRARPARRRDHDRRAGARRRASN